jgi:hypothetical protein
MKYIMERNGPEDLINAIFVRAAFDYRNDYRKYKNGDDSALKEIKKNEQFFNLTNKGKMILERLQGEQRNDK